MRRNLIWLATALLISAAAAAQTNATHDAFAAVAYSEGTEPGLGIFQVDRSGNLAMWQLHGLFTSNLKTQRYGIGGCSGPCPYRSSQPDYNFGVALPVTPALMPLDAHNLFYAFVAPRGSGSSTNPWSGGSTNNDGPGMLVIGSMVRPTQDDPSRHSGQWSVENENDKILPTTPSIGGAILPDNPSQPSLWNANVALLAYATTDKQLHLDAWWIPDWGNGVAPFGMSLATFTPTGTWDGNVSVAVRREVRPSDTDNPAPYGVYLAIRNGNSINVAHAPMGQLQAESRNNVIPSFRWETLSVPDGITSPTATVQTGPDNRVFVYYLNSKGQLASYLVGGTAAKPTFTLQPPVSLPTAPMGTPSVSFALGDANQTPPPSNTNLTGVKVPVYRNVFYEEASTPNNYNDIGQAQPAGAIAQYGWAMRDVLPGIPAVQQTLVGIIEGPPPIPGENAAITGPGNFSSVGYTRYGVENESSSDSTFSLKGGVLFNMSTEGGQLGGIDSEVDAKAGVGRTDMTQSSKTSLATYEADAQITTKNAKQPFNKDTNPYVVAGSGLAFLYGATYTGYRYHFIDANNQPIPGAAEYTEIFATKPGVNVYNFDLRDGGPYPVPGEMMSYVVTQNQYDQIANAKNTMLGFKDASGSEFGIAFSWAEGGKYAEEANTLNTTTETKSWNVDVSAMLGYGMHGDAGSWSIKAGDYLSIDSESSTSTSVGTSISTDVDFPAIAEGTAGVYTRFKYHTVPFKGSAAYATELVNYLTKYPTPSNTDLLQKLVGAKTPLPPPIGEPWKIAYLIAPGDYFMTPDEGGAGLHATATSAGASTPMSMMPLKTPPPVFAQMGINTPAQAATLQAAVRDLKAPLMLKKPKVDPIPPQVRQIASRLSADQVQQLDQYVSTLQKATYDAYRQRHPNVMPRTLVPPPQMQAMNGRPVRPVVKTEPKKLDFNALAQRPGMLRATAYPVKAAPANHK